MIRYLLAPVFVCALFTNVYSQEQRSERRPNIVLILADDLGRTVMSVRITLITYLPPTSTNLGGREYDSQTLTSARRCACPRVQG